jgi:(p)ppGpp synthase/HD superfamily hydrolase
MIYTDMTRAAMRIAFDAHISQTDKSGAPYIFHPIHLAEQMDTEVAVCAALLHDVREDTPVTFDDMRAAGISEDVIAVLTLLTHDERVPYLDYVSAIKASGNADAVRVKLADLRHNSDLTRFGETTLGRARAGRGGDSDLSERLDRYGRAIKILEG